jgi:hypothetical protein
MTDNGPRWVSRCSRRQLLAGTLLASGGVFGMRLALPRSAAQETADLRRILDVLVTAEAFAVTFLGLARQRAGGIDLGDDGERLLRVAQCEDEAHYHGLLDAGGRPTTTTFTIGARPVRDRDTLWETIVDLKANFVGAYMAAGRRFAALGELRLVELAYQIGAVEAQHLALARQLLGEPVASDRAFADWRFHDVAELDAVLRTAGFIDGRGRDYEFPGPLDRNCRGIRGLVAETSEDHATPTVPPTAPPRIAATPGPASPSTATEETAGTRPPASPIAKE